MIIRRRHLVSKLRGDLRLMRDPPPLAAFFRWVLIELRKRLSPDEFKKLIERELKASEKQVKTDLGDDSCE